MSPSAVAEIIASVLAFGLVGALMWLAISHARQARKAKALAERTLLLSRELDEARSRLALYTELLLLAQDDKRQAALAMADVDARIRERAATSRGLRGFSHDLRNPLTVISTNAALLLEGELTREQRFGLREVRDNAARMARMMKDMSDALDPNAAIFRAPVALSLGSFSSALEKRALSAMLARNVRVSVKKREGCPESILVDGFALVCVMDLVLADVATRVQTGALVLDISGEPNRLLIQIAPRSTDSPAESGGTDSAPASGREDDIESETRSVGLRLARDWLTAMGGRLVISRMPTSEVRYSIELPLEPPPATAHAPSEQRLRKALG